MALSVGGSKNKTKQSQQQQMAQSTSLAPRAYDAISGQMGALQNRQYQALDPNAFKAFQNPFEDEVIGAATADINANRDRAASQLQGDFAARKAFGNDRRGIQEAELTGQYDRTLATTQAGLRSQGFSQAQGIAQTENSNRNQFDANTQAQIAQLLALLSGETTTNGTSSGTSRGTSTGMNLGFSYGGR